MVKHRYESKGADLMFLCVKTFEIRGGSKRVVELNAHRRAHGEVGEETSACLQSDFRGANIVRRQSHTAYMLSFGKCYLVGPMQTYHGRIPCVTHAGIKA